MPSVLACCWMGNRKGIQRVKHPAASQPIMEQLQICRPV